jgi:hypothetical protein
VADRLWDIEKMPGPLDSKKKPSVSCGQTTRQGLTGVRGQDEATIATEVT